MAQPAFAHVGYHRTGTNFLQDAVFPRLAPGLVLPRESGWRFFAEGDFDREAATAFYAEAASAAGGRPLMVSHESLTGGHDRDETEPARRLHSLNPEMRVVVVLRAQPDILPSLHSLHIKVGGGLDLAGFADLCMANGKCDYLAMVEHLEGLFSKTNLLVLLYEDLRADPQGFLDRLCAFLDCEAPVAADLPSNVNARAGDRVQRFQRAANLALNDPGTAGGWRRRLRGVGSSAVALADRLLGMEAHKVGFDEALMARLTERYGPGNRALAERLGRPLQDLGYPA